MRAPAESTRYTIGTRSASARSWMRRIFSTVFGPHEPAFTVGSLAISATGRPSIRPRPVTTPSAPKPILLPVGEQRLLGEGALVEQQRHALAHRQLALLARLLAMALGPPAGRARSRRSARSWRDALSARRPLLPAGRAALTARQSPVPWRRRPRARLRSWRACWRASTSSRSDAGPEQAPGVADHGEQRHADHPARPEVRPAAPLATQMPTHSTETPSEPPASCTRRRRSASCA